MNNTIEAAIAAIQAGRMVIVTDHADRENEGDLVMAADHVTARDIAFMAAEGRGLICLTLEGAQVDRLQLPMMTPDNRSPHRTPFTVSIEAAEGVTTGISAADRARTIRVAADPAARPGHLVSPGHIFPLRAAPGGVLARDGHTEAAVDLARLAGCTPAGVICEIMNVDGTMARGAELSAFARAYDLPLIDIASLIAWRRAHEPACDVPAAPALPIVEEVATTTLPSRFGGLDLRLHVFRDAFGQELVALVKGDLTRGEPLVRLHSECLTGDALGSLRCDCGAQLEDGLRRVAEAECGVVLYLRGQEGRGIGLVNKIRAYALQDQGLDTVDANRALGLPDDARNYDMAAAVLQHFGVRRLVLLGNNPAKARALAAHGIETTRMDGLANGLNPFNRRYLQTKRTRMGHTLAEIFTPEDIRP